MKKSNRLLSMAVVVVGVTLASLVVAASSANASAYQCASSHGNVGSMTCNQVTGASLYVTKSSVDHSHYNVLDQYCNYKAKIWGTRRSGTAYSSESKATQNCSWPGFYVNFNVYVEFKDGSKFYGQAYHDGAWAPGAPAATIKK